MCAWARLSVQLLVLTWVAPGREGSRFQSVSVWVWPGTMVPIGGTLSAHR